MNVIRGCFFLMSLISLAYTQFCDTPLYKRAELYDKRINGKDVDVLLALIKHASSFKEGIIRWDEKSGRVFALYMRFNGKDSVRIDTSIAQLDSLWALKLSHAQKIELPKELKELARLEKLSITDTKMSAVPPVIGELENLKTVDLSNNLIESLPVELRQLKKLDNLNLILDNNKLKTIPSSLDFHFSDSVLSSHDFVRPAVAKNTFNNPFHCSELPPNFQTFLVSKLESQIEPFALFSLKHSYGKPLGYSYAIVFGYGVYAKKFVQGERFNIGQYRKKPFNLRLYQKGFHGLIEPGVRGIRFGGGVNWLPLKAPSTPQFSLRFVGVHFWETKENDREHGRRMYIGPELGFDFGGSIRVGYLKELEGDRHIVSIQGGLISYWLQRLSMYGIGNVEARIKKRRMKRAAGQ